MRFFDVLYATANTMVYKLLQKNNYYLSRVAANMYFPFGENRTKETGGFSSSIWK